MVTRRQFLRQFGLGLAAGAMGVPRLAPAFDHRPFPPPAPPGLRVALLADAHLPNPNPESAAARNLRMAVAQINALNPPAAAVLMAGDLTDRGDPASLELGQSILAALQAPYWLVPGECDRHPAFPSVWEEMFGPMPFSFVLHGVQICGLDTLAPKAAPGRAGFQVNRHCCHWLAAVLQQSSPATPLLILSHAPLYRLFRPWQWWTEQAESLYHLLAARDRVYLLHGHVHQNIAWRQDRLCFQGLRSTAWPLPDVRQGIPSGTLPGQLAETDPAGCGWMLLTLDSRGHAFLQDHLWGT